MAEMGIQLKRQVRGRQGDKTPGQAQFSQRCGEKRLRLVSWLGPDLSRRLQDWAGERPSDLWCALLAGLAICLHRYSGLKRIPVDCPPRLGELGTSGEENAAALSIEVGIGPTFEKTWQRLKGIAEQACRQPDLPPSGLQEESKTRLENGSQNGFEVALALKGYHAQLPLSEGAVSLLAVRQGGQLAIEASFNSARFSRVRVERLLRHFSTLLASALEQPDQNVGQLGLLSVAERQALLREWPRRLLPYPQQATLHELYRRQAQLHPDSIGVVAAQGDDRAGNLAPPHLSYGRLGEASGRLAQRLQGFGVGPEVYVGVCMERCPEMIIALLAVLKAGGAYVPVDPAYPARRKRFMIEDSGAPLLLTQLKFKPLFSRSATRLLFMEDEAGAAEISPHLPRLDAGPDNQAYAIYTSGSTGLPKGVQVAHRGVVRLSMSADYVRFDRRERVLQITSLSFDVSAFEIWGSLLNGSTLVLMPPGTPSLDGIEFTVQHFEATTAWLSAGLFRVVADNRIEALRGLGQLLAGGEAVSPAHARLALESLPGCRMTNGYGPTENTVFSCCYTVERADQIRETFPIGPPIANSEAHVLDQNLSPVPIGVAGELFTGGDGVARGYLKRPALTAERFIPHPLATCAGDRLYRTGDRVAWMPDGNIEFLGRMDDQVKIRGFRIEPGEIEANLQSHPQVRQCLVMPWPDPAGGKRLIAHVIAQSERPGLDSELRCHLGESLPDYMVPTAFVFLKRWPLTPNGKIDRKALPQPELGRAGHGRARPGTAVEKALAEAWQEVLGLQEVGTDDEFLSLGGHSLAATQVSSRIRKMLSLDLPVQEVFRYSTISRLASRIEEIRAEERREAEFLSPRKAPRNRPLPLAFSQQRVWLLEQLTPGNIAYNFQVTIRFKGRLQRPALDRALTEIVRRHEILRSVFVESQGEPCQKVLPAWNVRAPLIDLSALPVEARDRQCDRQVWLITRRAFDVTRLPLVRWILFRIGPQSHVFLHCEHHLIHDGWGFGRLMHELRLLYKAFSQAKPSPLKALPIQFADVAVWERERMQGEILRRRLDFWKARLQGMPPLVELPADRPRPKRPSYRGSGLKHELSASLYRRLKRLSGEQGSTLFMTLLAAFKVLIFRYTGRRDLVVGSAAANRLTVESEEQLGMLVNNLALRSRLQEGLTFDELLRQVRGTVEEAFDRQDVPFDKVVEAVHPERDPSRNPLIQAVFSFHDSQVPRLEMGDLSGYIKYRMNGTAKFDVNVIAIPYAEQRRGEARTEGEEGITLLWEASADLFNPSRVRRMVHHFETLLEGIAAHPSGRLCDLPLISRAEKSQLLLEWNDSAASHPHISCAHHLVAQQARRSPDTVSVSGSERFISYGELLQRARQLAGRLRQRGVSADQPVAVCMSRSPELIIAMLGILESGGAYLPLDAANPDRRLESMLKDSGARLMLVSPAYFERFAGRFAVMPFPAQEEARSAPAFRPEDSLPEGAKLAYVIYTSGSTGRPKGVAVPHRALLNFLFWQRQAYRLEPGERTSSVAGLGFDACIWEIWHALASGATLQMAPENARLSAPAALHWLVEQAVEVAFLPTPLAEAVLQLEEWPRRHSLRSLFAGGDRLHAKAVGAGTPVPLYNLYGPSENTIVTSSCRVWPSASHPPIGRPVANARIYILDRELGLAPQGVHGELYCSGSNLARGYLGRPSLTADRFIPDPFSVLPGKRLYRTGDLGRYRFHGQIEFLGRVDHQVKLRGLRIELGEIEAVLNGHPQVKEAVALVAEGEQLAAYLVPKGGRLSSQSLRGYLQERLPSYMVPGVLVTLEELPLTPNGKVDRRALLALGAPSRQRTREHVAARTPAEAKIARIWRDVLAVGRIGVTDNFFELGGHSLMATQIISQIRQAFGVELPMQALFDAPSVAQMSQEVQSARPLPDLPPLRPRPQGANAPLSFAQQRLWILERLTPGNPFYNVPAAWSVEGSLRADVLQASLAQVVRRHESLRTNFSSGDPPRQVISRAFTPEVPVIDLSRLEENSKTAMVARLRAQEAQRPFDLAGDRLMRVRLLTLGPQQAVLMVTFHHIVADGWSVSVFIKELATFYAAATGQPAEAATGDLPDLPVQYADFAAWQRECLQGETLRLHSDFWKERLKGAPQLELPTDRPRPRIQTYRGGRHLFALQTGLSQRLRDLSLRQGATLYMTLLAAFQVLLHRYTGQQDLVVGTPVANRTLRETEGLIGFFVNTLVMRNRLSDGLAFSEFLQQVSQRAMRAYDHQDLPFEKLVDLVQPQRALSHNPIFQVVFALQNLPRLSAEQDGLSFRLLPSEARTTRFDLEFHLWEAAERIEAVVAYDRDLFEETTIRRLSGHFGRLLQGIAQQPDQPIKDFSLLSRAERQQLMEWAGSEMPLPQTPVVHRLFEEVAAANPDSVALDCRGDQISYACLNSRANRLARLLRDHGVGAETPVAACMERCLQVPEAFLGILKAGGSYLPVDPSYPRRRLQEILEDSRSPLALTLRRWQERLDGSSAAALCLDEVSLPPQQGSESDPGWPADGAKLAYAMFTSGSTGRPKGVAVAHRSIVRLVRDTNFAKFSRQDVFLLASALSFDASTLELWGALLNGGRLALLSGSSAISLSQLGRVIQSHQVTFLWLTAGLFHQMAEENPEALGPVQQLLAGGDVLAPRHVRRVRQIHPGLRLINGYGPTENTTFSCCHAVREEGLGPVPIGRPVTNSWVQVVDANAELVPMGVVGELCLGGHGLARGYLARPALTARQFVPDPLASQPGARLYRSGDLVKWRSDGLLDFLGRADRQVKVRGFRIELEEIEAALSSHPLVGQAVVVARSGPSQEKRLLAYLVPDPAASTSVDDEALRRHLAARLPRFMLPDHLVRLERFPLTPNGKVDRDALPDPQDPVGQEGFVAPRGPVESVVARIWEAAFEAERISASHNFFELGGNSLLATRVVSRIERAFGVELPLRALFEEPTVQGLAERIERGFRQAPAPPIQRVGSRERLPLSFGQQRLWFLDRLMPGNPYYNIPMAWSLKGRVDVAALSSSLDEIVRRHDTLRSRFQERDGSPLLTLTSAWRMGLAVVDLAGLGSQQRQREALRLACAEALKPFDLASGGLLRTLLLRLEDDSSIFLATMHHIVSDGWSMGVFLKELATIYAACLQGSPADLPELPIQYADFADWQNRWLKGKILDRQLSYWTSRLEGVAPLALPTDRPRPRVRRYRGGRVSIRLSPALRSRIEALCRERAKTLYMALLAAFQALLHRSTGQTDIVVGSPVANRNRPEVEGLIGFFVNALAMRSRLKPEMRFAELLDQVADTSLQAFAHQDLPFEQLVGSLDLERDLSRNPVFQVLFAMQERDVAKLRLAGLRSEWLPLEARTARFDLSLHLREEGEGLTGYAAFDADLFHRTTVVRLVACFESLLEAAAAHPQRRLAELPLLSAAQRHQLSKEWTGPPARLDGLLMHERFEEQSARTPHALAVACDGRQISYGALDRRANRLARLLIRQGAKPEVPTGLLLERSLEMAIGILGVLKSGSPFLCLDPENPAQRLSLLIEYARLSILVSLADAASRPDIAVPCLVRLDDCASLAEEPSPPQPAADADNPAYLIYTSGSTGRPKAVAITHRGIGNYIEWMGGCFPLGSSDRVLRKTPVSFDVSVGEFIAPLAQGALLVMAEPDAHRDSASMARTIVEQQITALQVVPSQLQALLQEEGLERCDSLRRLFCGGEALDKTLCEQWRKRRPAAPLYNLYGPAEASIDATWRDCRNEIPGSRVPIGRPVLNSSALILDGGFRRLPIGAVGELHLSGAGLARGYWGRPGQTAERFRPHPQADSPGQRLYLSGDLARWLPEGELEFLGRRDDQVKLRGVRIELGEIEALLRQYPGVHAAAAAIQPGATGNTLVAYLAGADSSAGLAAELRGFLGEYLPAYMIPAAFVALDELPLNPNGKVDRRALPVPQAVATPRSCLPPRDPVEQQLASIWQGLLEVQEIGVEDNFFELGGHSLLATRVVAEIRKSFGLELPLRAVFEAPTIAALARTLSSGSTDRLLPQIPVGQRTEELPLSFSQQRLWFLEQLLPGSALYNTPLALELEGPLNLGALQGSLNAIVRRHEILRTCFPARDGRPRQVIVPSLELSLPEVDLSRLAKERRGEQAIRLLQQDAQIPFDLAKVPLLRLTLIRLSNQRAYLSLVKHHIVSDAWSSGLLLREMVEAYRAILEGRPAALPALPIQYADFAIWQRGWMRREVLQERLSYWKSQLGGLTPLDLPVDRPRPARPSWRGRVHTFRIPAGLVQRLDGFCQRKQTSLFMLLMAAFQALLHRWAGKDDVVVGSPIANRIYPGVEHLIGFFVNTLALRADLSGQPTFSGLLRQISRTALDAYTHQDIPFERLVDELQPERDLSRNPLFQVVFSLQDSPLMAMQMEGVKVQRLVVPPRRTRFELEFYVRREGERLACGFVYEADLFDPSTIARMARHFERLLKQAMANPGQPVGELRLLDAQERQQLMRWSGPSPQSPQALIHRLFREQAAQRRDAIAADCGERCLSYGELDARSDALAGRLTNSGIGPEGRVALCMPRCLELPVATLGILKAGAAYVPLEASYPQDRQAFMLQDSRISLALSEKPRPELHGCRVLTCFGADSEEGAAPAADFGPLSLAYVMYTSGTTGRPKGVAVTHGAVVRLVRQTDYADFSPGQVFLHLSSISFDASTLEIWGPLLNGGRLALFSSRSPSLYEISRAIQRHQVSLLWLTAGLFHQMAEDSLEGLKPVRQLLAGGDVLSPPHVKKVLQALPGLRLINGYGPTENTTFTCCHTMSSSAEVDQPVPIGRPIPNTSAFVVDRCGQLAPQGVPGELWIGGSGLARGYQGRAALTADRFRPHPFGDRLGQRLYRSGDQVRWTPSGVLQFLGRLDRQVKVRGFRIELEEIEAALGEHPLVGQALALAQPDPAGGKRLAAYLTCPDPEAASSEELRSYAALRLPEFMVPSVFVFMERFPLTPNGKIDRSALPSAGEAASDEWVPPANPVEAKLAQIWQQVLGVERVGAKDDFFRLGGHSLSAARVVSRIRQSLGVELPLRDLFESPTLQDTAKRVEQALPGSSRPPLQRLSRRQEMPLSFAQQRLWFLDQLNPGNSFYNIKGVWQAEGELQIGVLRATLLELGRRHEVLRARFVAPDGYPLQQTVPHARLSAPLLDLSRLPQERRQQEAQQLADLESGRPFCLDQAPLMRMLVLRLASSSHRLLLTIHHIIADGWSLGVLLDELASTYQALLRAKPSPLPEPHLQYADFAVWQRRWLSGQELERQLSYWRGQLQGLTPLQLPTDRPRPRLQAFRGGRQAFALPESLNRQLKEIAASQGATLYMILLAAFQVLLSRCSGQNDIVTGSPIANRDHPGTERLVGFFANTIALRTDLGGDPPFRSLLRQVTESALQAFAHQDLPFEKLVEDLQPERDLSRNPIFQVLFSLQNLPKPVLQMGDLKIRSRPSGAHATRFDLEMHLLEADQGQLQGVLFYDRDLFDASTAKRMCRHFERLLRGIAAQPDQRLSQLPLLSSAERHQQGWEWNDTQAGWPSESLLHELFEAQADRRPHRVALSAEAESECDLPLPVLLSYGQLQQRTASLAQQLVGLGAGPEVLVGVWAERSPEMVCAMLAILKSGSAYLPLDPLYPPQRLQYMLQDSAAPLLLTAGRMQAEPPGEGIQTLCVDSFWPPPSGLASNGPKMDAGQLAYSIYTSGSTGLPKGVQIEHRAAVNFLEAMRRRPGMSAQDALLALTTISFDISVLELFLPLSLGARVELADRRQGSDGALLAARLQRSQATAMQATPATWRMLLESGWDGSPALDRILCGGEGLPRDLSCLLAKRCRQLWNVYGPTETTVWSSAWRIRPQGLKAQRSEALEPIGRPIANTSFHVLDPQMRPVPAGVQAELFIGASGVARGYLSRPALTAQRFVPDPFSQRPGQRLYRTGDLVRLTSDGVAEFLGRIDHQVKIRGFRIELGEIESALAAHPAVQQAVVTAWRSSAGDRLAAYLVAEGFCDELVQELRRHLGQALPSYMIPSRFVPLPSLPLTRSGKVDRAALPDPESIQDASGKAKVTPRDAVEARLARIWREALGVGSVGVHDDFFRLGGHSLLATRITAQIRQQFGLELPLRSIFEAPTIAELARCIENALPEEPPPPPIRPAAADQPPPLSFAQQRVWFLHQLAPRNPFYNIPAQWKISGALKIEALYRSLAQIVRRHEVLQTRFFSRDGQSHQRVEATTELRFAVADLRGIDPRSRRQQQARLCQADACRPFRLDREAPLRALLLQADEQQFTLQVTIHHIAADAWSLRVLFKEMLDNYGAFCAGQPSPLAALPFQYADFAHWQRGWLQGEVLERQLAFWKGRLQGKPALDLPADRPRPAVQAFRGGSAEGSLSGEQAGQLASLGQSRGATSYMTLLAAFQALMHRLTGQQSFLIGTPIANRHHPGTEELIGFFTNTLALRADLSDDPSFLHLVERVSQEALDAFAHQDLPFEKLVEALHPRRDPSRNPLFQVMFSWQAAPSQSVKSDGLTVQAQAAQAHTTRFDLELHLWQGSQGIRMVLLYDQDLFDGTTVQRLLEHYRTLAASIIAQPERPISELRWQSKAETHQLLTEWNDTQADLSSALPVQQAFRSQASRTPHASALACAPPEGEGGGHSLHLSYRSLQRLASALANSLGRLGAGPETIVGICLQRSPLETAALLGILECGAAYLPLDPAYPSARLEYMLSDSGAPLLLTRRRLAAQLPGKARALCLEDIRLLDGEVGGPGLTMSDDSLAYQIYTSGSTGRPKGVQVSHGSLANFLHSMRCRPGLVAGDRVLGVTTLSFDISALEIFLPLTVGACLLPVSRSVAADGVRLSDWIDRSQATVMQATPATWRLVTEAGWQGNRRLEAWCGGEALDRSLARRLIERCSELWNLYGPTETTIWSAAARVEDDPGPVAISDPIASTQIHVLDRRLQALPIGVPGELHIGGRGLARGYFRRPALSAEKFIPDPFSKQPGQRLYKSGDLVRRRGDGSFDFLGRIDHQVKVRGFRIELGEIESLLSGHPQLEAAVVTVQPEPSGNNRLVAYLVAAQPPGPSTEELRTFLGRKLPAYMVPALFVSLESMPLTPSGKIDRRSLPAPSGERPRLSASYQAPQSEMERHIGTIWKELLQLEKVGIHDNFFDLGGHSLLLLQAHSKLQDGLKLEVSVADLFGYPTISALARFLSRRPAASQSRQEKRSQSEARRAALIRQRAAFKQVRRTSDKHGSK